MTNGVPLKMSNGKDVIRFWIFKNGTVVEYTVNGMIDVADFINRYKYLCSKGYKEV